MVALDGADDDPADLDDDAPGGGPDLLGRHAVVDQHRLDFAAADHRRPGPFRQDSGVAVVVEGRVADEDRVGRLQIVGGAGRERAVGEERIDQDPLARPGDLVAGDAEEANVSCS